MGVSQRPVKYTYFRMNFHEYYDLDDLRDLNQILVMKVSRFP